MDIKNFFHIYFFKFKFKVLYAQLDDGTYTKTFTKNNITNIEIITAAEYAAAMTYNNYLKIKRKNNTPN